MVDIFHVQRALETINLHGKMLPILFQPFLCVQKILIKCFCFCEKHVENRKFHMTNQGEILNCSSN